MEDKKPPVDPDILHSPGLKWRPRAGGPVPYWIPPAKDVKAGWKTQVIKLDPLKTPDELAAQCQKFWAGLMMWRQGQPTKTRFTISWLIHQYQTDQFSPYRTVKQKTRQGYDQSCKIIDGSIGSLQVDAELVAGILRPRIIGQDVRRWHYEWSQPDKDGIATTPVRAWHAMTMLRILFSYALELGVPGASDLRELVGAIRVKSPEAREAAPERAMVLAHVAKAIDKGLLSMAITTLAQFEFTERRTHIIGTWEGKQWRPGWLWTGIADWQINYHQTKVGKVERSYNLRDTPALLDLLQRIPEERRIGPIIVCERTGKPWKERHYMQVFRAVAREIGIPDDIWSMDMRAGAATETGGLMGITILDLQASGGWKDEKMARRYDRGNKARAGRVVKMRQAAARTGEE